MKLKSYIKLSAFAALFPIISFGSALGTNQPDNFVVIEDQKPAYKKVSIPPTLTYEQVRALRNKEIIIGSTHLEALPDQKSVLFNTLPGDKRIITNAVYNRKYNAALQSSYTLDDQHPSEFTAIYEIKDWFSFIVTGYDANLKSLTFIKNIDAEAADEDRHAIGSTLVKYGYDHPSTTHIRLTPEDLGLLKQHMFIAVLQQVADVPEVVPERSEAGLRKAMLNAGMYIFSFTAKPLIEKHVPYARAIYPELDGVVKLLGYPTVTHFLKDVAVNHKINSPLLLKDDKDTEPNAGKVGAIVPRRDEGLHATSRVLGHVVSFIPWGSTVRTLGTMYVERQGYPTITHYLMGHKEMTDEQILEKRNSQTLLAEQVVAMGFETFVPYGQVFVAISHAGASILFDKSSMTAYAIEKLTSKAINR